MKRVAVWVMITIGGSVMLLGMLLATGPSDVLFSIAVLGSFTAVGGVLALRRPDNAMGWILLSVAMLWSIPAVPYTFGQFLVDRGETGSLVGWLLWWPFWVPPLGLMGTQVLLRFPDGRLPSPGWRWFSWGSLALIAVASLVVAGSAPTLAPEVDNPTYSVLLTRVAPMVLLTLPVAFGVSAYSVFVRYRHAGSSERVQIRWIAWAGAVFVTTWGVTLVTSLAFGDSPLTVGLQALTIGAYALVPLAIGFAVLRYRLYEIDRIISRTTSYALVTGLLLVVYVSVVWAVPQLLPEANDLAVAAATLAAAALFRPLLSRVRSVVDRRFDRSRYDAERAVEEFAVRLRDEVDTDQVYVDLHAVIRRTVAPSVLGLWLPGDGS